MTSHDTRKHHHRHHHHHYRLQDLAAHHSLRPGTWLHVYSMLPNPLSFDTKVGLKPDQTTSLSKCQTNVRAMWQQQPPQRVAFIEKIRIMNSYGEYLYVCIHVDIISRLVSYYIIIWYNMSYVHNLWTNIDMNVSQINCSLFFNRPKRLFETEVSSTVV